MRDPFLCPDCQKLGYCRKYHSPVSSQATDYDLDFYNHVNKKPNIPKPESFHGDVKLMSLEKIRAKFQLKKEEAGATPEQVESRRNYKNFDLNFRLASLIKYPVPNQTVEIITTYDRSFSYPKEKQY